MTMKKKVPVFAGVEGEWALTLIEAHNDGRHGETHAYWVGMGCPDCARNTQALDVPENIIQMSNQPNRKAMT